MSPAKSLFHAFAQRLAEHLTRDAPDPDAAYLAMVSTLYSVAAEVCGGEWVYIPQRNVVELAQTRQRINRALQLGEEPTQIARREGVDPSLVRRIRRRGTIGP